MSRPALPVLTSTGDPAHGALETNVRRMADQLNGQIGALSAADIAFTAVAADWVAPVPTTLAEALGRLAAAAGAHPVP